MFYVEQTTLSGQSIVGYPTDERATRKFQTTRSALSACGVPFNLRVIDPQGNVIEQAEDE